MRPPPVVRINKTHLALLLLLVAVVHDAAAAASGGGSSGASSVNAAAVAPAAARAAAAAAVDTSTNTTIIPWQQDRFAIGFWVDPMVPPARFDAEYARIAAANFTILLGGYGATRPPEVKLQIAAARRAGLPAIPSFCGGACANLSGPGVWGFQIIDEPQVPMFPAVAKLVAQAKAAGNLAFVNLFPDSAMPLGPTHRLGRATART
jgi:hypothetical protein